MPAHAVRRDAAAARALPTPGAGRRTTAHGAQAGLRRVASRSQVDTEVGSSMAAPRRLVASSGTQLGPVVAAIGPSRRTVSAFAQADPVSPLGETGPVAAPS